MPMKLSKGTPGVSLAWKAAYCLSCMAAVLYVVLGHWLTVDGSEANQVLSIIAFLILCIIMPLALGFVASSLTTMVRGIRLGLPNSLLGSAVSVVKFALLISFALNMMGNLNILNAERTAGSRLYAPTTALLPFVQTKAEDESASNDGVFDDLKAVDENLPF